MKEITADQITEMREEVRRLHSIGEPESATGIKLALADGRYFMGLRMVPEVVLPQPKKTAKRDAWVEFALSVSDIEPEIIDDATRGDIMGMLKANGLAE